MAEDSRETPFSTPREGRIEIVTYMGNQMLKYLNNSDLVATVWTIKHSGIYTITIAKDAARGKSIMHFTVGKHPPEKLLDIWENIEKHVFLRLAQR